MKKIIALCGFKGTGKDFVSDLIQEGNELTYTNLSISDNVKILAAKEKGFLDEDDKIIKASKAKSESMWKLKGMRKIKVLSTPTKDMTNSEILQKVNIYKNYDELSTRKALYDYFDEEKENGYEHVSLDMINSIKKCKNPGVIITDTRTLLEAIDILLEGGLLLNLYNSRSEGLENIALLHFSEYELSKKIKGKRIGFPIDITSRDKDYLKRSINEIINLFYKSFSGYSEHFIEDLNMLRTLLIKVIPDVEKASNITYKSKDVIAHKKNLKIIDQFRDTLQASIEKEYENIFRF